MNGRDYVARVTLYAKGGEVRAVPGEFCDRVDPISLPWLLEQGYIQPSEARVDAEEQARVTADLDVVDEPGEEG